MNERTVLITGAAGFLGRQVARAFAAAGWGVTGVDIVPQENLGAWEAGRYHALTLPDPALGRLLEAAPPRVCVHCAGRASVAGSLADPAEDFRDGPVLTFALLEALRRHSPGTRLLFLSSAAVYGNPSGLPVGEEHPVAPLSPYGYHKRLGELLCEEFSRLYGMETASVRIFSAYGQGLRRQVVWDICERALKTGALRLRGTGLESRDFVHGSDVARALLVLAGRAPARGEVYNLATGVETSIGDLAGRLLQMLGLSFAPEFDGRATPGDPLHWRADIGRLRALGWEPAMGLEEGLRAMAAWARAELHATS